MALLAVWIALAIAVAATVAGGVVAVRAAVELNRELRRFRLSVVLKLESLADPTEVMLERAERAQAAPERLAPSLERLRGSLAQLSVLTSTLVELRRAAGRAAPFFPRT
jgi:hypothetical protein